MKTTIELICRQKRRRIRAWSHNRVGIYIRVVGGSALTWMDGFYLYSVTQCQCGQSQSDNRHEEKSQIIYTQTSPISRCCGLDDTCVYQKKKSHSSIPYAHSHRLRTLAGIRIINIYILVYRNLLLLPTEQMKNQFFLHWLHAVAHLPSWSLMASNGIHPSFQIRMEDALLATVFPSSVINSLIFYVAAHSMPHPLTIPATMSATRMLNFSRTRVPAYGVPPTPLVALMWEMFMIMTLTMTFFTIFVVHFRHGFEDRWNE